MNALPEVGVGIVGYGLMGRAHAYGWRTAPHVRDLPCVPRLRVMSGRDEDALRRAASLYGVEEVTTDWRALVERPDVQIVDVCTPPGTHPEIVEAAAAAGKAVLCEKPLAADLASAAAAVAAVERAGVPNAIGFNYRRLPALSLMKGMIGEGRVGRILLWRATWLSDEFLDPEIPFDWRFERRMGATTIADLGSHLIDLALWMVGEIAEVAAQSETFTRERAGGTVDVDEASSALVRFTGGARGAFEMARTCARRPCDFWVEVNGTEGTLRFDYPRLNELWFGETGDDERHLRDAPHPRRAPIAPLRARLVAARPGRRLRDELREPGRRPPRALAERAVGAGPRERAAGADRMRRDGARRRREALGLALTGDRRLALSRNARLRWDAGGRLIVEGARSTEGLAIELDDVALLDAFATPADPGSVVGLGARRSLIDDLVRVGVLVPAGGGTVASGHFADPQRQLAMLWDSLRMDAYRRVLERRANGNVLVELGCGHGVLACLAVRAGARRVYAIEESSMIDVAREVARSNGLEDRIVFVEGNSLDVELPERADVVYSDLIGPDPLGAGMLVYMHDAAARFLRVNGVLVPARMTLLTVGVDSRRIARETEAARGWLCDADDLSATFGLDLSPLREASRAAFAQAYDDFSYKEFLDPGRPAGGRGPHPDPRGARRGVRGRAAPIRRGWSRRLLPLHVESDGTLNAMATYAAVHLDGQTTLTTSPYAPERPSAWGGQFLSTLTPHEVAAGTTVEVEAEVTPWTSPAVHYRHRPGPASARAGALFDR